MATNLPPIITVNRNLASTLKNYIKEHGGKNVSESEMNAILQKVAKFDSERDTGKRDGGSIFSGGNKYLGGDGTNFRVNQGQQIQLSAEEYNEIFAGFIEPLKTETPIEEKKMPEIKPAPLPEVITKPETTELPDKLEVPKDVVRQQNEQTIENLDGKVLSRSVNGKEQEIIVLKQDGEKVRYALNEDGSLGEELVTVSTAGKNKYVTKSKFEADVRTILKLSADEEIPSDLQPQYVTIGGESSIIFKKDGKTMDGAALRDYMKDYNAEKYFANDSQLKGWQEQLKNLNSPINTDMMRMEGMDKEAFETEIQQQQDAQKLSDGIKGYKNTIKNWQKGATVTINNTEYKCATLPTADGDLNVYMDPATGKMYSVGLNGEPDKVLMDPSHIIA